MTYDIEQETLKAIRRDNDRKKRDKLSKDKQHIPFCETSICPGRKTLKHSCEKEKGHSGRHGCRHGNSWNQEAEA